MSAPDRRALWDLTATAGLPPARFLADGGGHFPLAHLVERRTLDAPLERFRGKSLLLTSERQLPAVLAVLQLDGIARRILLCPPDLPPTHLPALLAEAEIDGIVTDGTVTDSTGPAAPPGFPIFACGTAPSGPIEVTERCEPTEWLLLTSGTTGRPKLVLHSLGSLIGPLNDGLVVAPDAVWATFYDMRRYGGLTIMMRALLGGSSLVLSQAGETVADFLTRAGQAGVTHILGTPSHWRRALMSEAAGHIAPVYVRLSGEVVDQAILNQLGVAFPAAEIVHAFASTEAGFAFDVRDRRAGFPAALITETGGRVAMRVEDGSLRIRSTRTASRYLGAAPPLLDADEFLDTGDMVELRGDRYYFVGRREGVINVGGQKVHPEEVEGVINQHPDVQVSRVYGRPSPILGALVVADIVVRPPGRAPFQTLKDEILDACRQALPAHKVPTMLQQVPALDIAASGKLVRRRS